MLTAQAKHFSAMKFAFTLYHLCILIFVKFNTVKVQGENTISEFTDHLIVPHLFPTPPKEICSVIYEPGLIILTGKPYFPYQIQGLPEIIWNHKEETFYTVHSRERLSMQSQQPPYSKMKPIFHLPNNGGMNG
ncbi:putative odorant-binding protein A5 isoform X3 [Planococcus citri]|uniref:putative odorant-binding protein A5 isoform X3 n=1 Tax=Planococcus citri TaxID=170843 RepID=UPI0031F8C8F5